MAPKSYNDVYLLDGVNARTSESFEWLHEKLYKYLFALALRIVKDEFEAEDAVLSSLINLYKCDAQFETVLDIDKYVTKMVKNAAIDRLLKKGKAKAREAVHTYRFGDDEMDEQVWDAFARKVQDAQFALRRQLVHEAFEALDYKCVEVLRLYFAGKKTKEVMEIMGLKKQNALNNKANGLVRVADFVRNSQWQTEALLIIVILSVM